MIAPCKDCQERNPPDCHIYCKRYKAFETKNLEKRLAKARENDKYSEPKRPVKYERIRRGIK